MTEERGMIENRLLALAVARLSFLRCHEKVLVSEVVLSEAFFASLRLGDVEQIVGRRVRTSHFDPAVILREAENDSFLLSATDAKVVAVVQAAYPPQLREIFDPPFLLFVRGALPSPNDPQVAIVGTRAPTSAGRDAARALAAECADSGVPVVSGLALGVDGEAHAGAVDASGATVAVLGSGIDSIYPRAHKSLAARILEGGGALVSEYPPRTEPRKYHFPARNRIISGLSRSVVVVEAPERSGALITADYALDQGRDLFVHAVCKASSKGEGGRRLMVDGAPAVRAFRDIAHDWGHAAMVETGMTAPEVATSHGEPVRPATSPGVHVARALQRELDL